MHALQMGRVLKISALAPQELQIGWSNSTNFFLALWDDCGEEDRSLLVAFLRKAHIRLARKIITAETNENLNAINMHVNRVLAREAVLAANSPSFARHASNLKDIIVEAVAIRINRGSGEGAPENAELISRFQEVLKKVGV